MLIDGGPSGVGGEGTFATVLGPRLGELRLARNPSAPLPIELVFVSHIDDDHIGGVIDLFRTLDGIAADYYSVGCLWHNSFPDLLGENDREAVVRALEELPGIARYADAATRHTAGSHLWVAPQHEFAVASVDQGRDLRQHAQYVGTTVNCGFDDLVMAPASGGRLYQAAGGLDLHVIGPVADRIEALRREWRRARQAGREAEALARLASRPDVSPTNLASIVVVAIYAGWRILFTGDARSSHIRDWLRRAGLQDGDGVARFDVVKLPHHGSARNVDADFFAEIRADHYLISANGRDDNPDAATLELLVASRLDDDFTIWFTNRRSDAYPVLEERLDAFEERHAARSFAIEYRKEAALSLPIELGEPFLH